MNSRGGTNQKVGSAKAMLCPCCGDTILLSAFECRCGARFVGPPLDAAPIRVLRFAPALTSVALLALVAIGSIAFTKWLGFLAVVVAWSAWRAMRLGKQYPDWYGGRRVAALSFAVSVAGVTLLASYGTIRLPEVFENYRTQETAATRAAMYHYWEAIEEFKRGPGIGQYPKDVQDLRKNTGESLPQDSWDQSIRYQPISGQVADRSIQKTGFANTHFELRSPGPDGVIGTDDDIVMRDGIFLTSAELKKQLAAQQIR